MSLVGRFVRTMPRWSEPVKTSITLREVEGAVMEECSKKFLSISKTFTSAVTPNKYLLVYTNKPIGLFASKKSNLFLKSNIIVPSTFTRLYSKTSKEIPKQSEKLEEKIESIVNSNIYGLRLVIKNKDELIKNLAINNSKLECENKRLKTKLEKSSSSLEFRNMVDDLLDDFAIELPELSRNEMAEKIINEYIKEGKSIHISRIIPMDYVRILYHLLFNDYYKVKKLKKKIVARGWTYEKFAFIVTMTKMRTNNFVYERLSVESIVKGLKEFGLMDINLDKVVLDLYKVKNS